LQDISAETKINIKFLEAIEEGNFEILPTPYIRAFLKEYARRVDYDPEKLLRQYDEHTHSGSVTHPEQESVPVSTEEVKTTREFGHPPHLKIVSLSLIVFGSIALVVYYTMFRPGIEDFEEITARPFQDVVRELEEQSEELPIAVVDSPAAVQQAYPDSLVLYVAATDTVWLTILIDNIQQQEYILRPDNRMQWKAANQFLMTVGNAGGVALRLNNDTLGVLGRQGEVMRNITITRDGIQR
jgi:cytoskeletal protein RodZ